MNEESKLSKSAQAQRLQIVFVVQPGINGLLDVARKTFSETLEDMQKHMKEIGETNGIQGLKLEWHARRGYHLSFPLTPLNTEASAVFIQVSKTSTQLFSLIF